MNYSLNVKSSSIVHTLLSNCVKLLGKVQKLLIKCISYSVISKRIRVVSPKFYTVRKNFTGPPVPRSRQISSLIRCTSKDIFDTMEAYLRKQNIGAKVVCKISHHVHPVHL